MNRKKNPRREGFPSPFRGHFTECEVILPSSAPAAVMVTDLDGGLFGVGWEEYPPGTKNDGFVKRYILSNMAILGIYVSFRWCFSI